MGEIYPEEEQEKRSKPRFKKQTLVLDTYGTNLSKRAVEGKLDPVIGRTEEILRVIQILGRRRKNNPVLVGEPGVGKTAIVEGLALKMVEGNVPVSLQGKVIYTLELSTIVAGTKYRGQFEERMKSIVDELILNPHIIVFIDELHTLVGAGGSTGSLDASNIIKPALARGEIRCIGATTFDEFRENIEGDGALDRRFQKVTVEPPTLEQTIEILSNIRHKYEEHHSVSYDDTIIDLIVKLADRYIMDRYFPDKAVDILDEVGSYKHLTNMKVPQKIKALEEKLVQKENAKRKAVSRQLYEVAAKERDAALTLKERIKQDLAIWKEQMAVNQLEITEDDVLKVVSKATGVPIEKISDKENKNLLGLNKHLSSKVIGQDEAVDKIAVTVQRNRVGIRKRNRTMGNFIFLGPTGVGKTQLAKELTEYLFNSEDSLIRVDMSEYMEPHSISKLIGAPPGYVGFEGGGFLTEQVKRKPHSVILFDEIEKAHPEVFNVLLQMLDDGQLTDSLGRTVDFRNCLIILTSNTGSRKLQDFGSGIGFESSTKMVNQAEEEKTILRKALKNKFSPEFLNRIDEIVVFNRLTEDNVMDILTKECKELAINLEEVGGYNFKITKGAKTIILNQGYDPKYGARPLRRTIERMIENKISEYILKGELKEGGTINVKGTKGELIIDITNIKE
jgi:ATP-dependent Clp protease ATP-binding subunit ClpC|tara:strand:- start:13 stop:2040 length:2028 start_codon:yes stop_codon:yes gene_type:complete